MHAVAGEGLSEAGTFHPGLTGGRQRELSRQGDERKPLQLWRVKDEEEDGDEMTGSFVWRSEEFRFYCTQGRLRWL